MSYNKVLKKLQSLPPHEKELAAGVYVFSVGKNGNPHCGCAIGKVLPAKTREKLWKAQLAAEAAEKQGDYYPNPNDDGVHDLLRFMFKEKEYDITTLNIVGMRYDEMVSLQQENDDYEADDNRLRTRKRRYAHIINWLKEEIKAEEEEK